MNNRLLITGMSVTILSAFASSALASELVPTMNQPDNGFFEGPDPEWATLHATDMNGTANHRQYHRDGAQAHQLWHEQNRSEQGTAAYEEAHRLFHETRNEHHRDYHTAPTNS